MVPVLPSTRVPQEEKQVPPLGLKSSVGMTILMTEVLARKDNLTKRTRAFAARIGVLRLLGRRGDLAARDDSLDGSSPRLR